eukprot:SAG11_NODE_1141_length_5707_cov_14.979315_3_plen_110_part_00
MRWDRLVHDRRLALWPQVLDKQLDKAQSHNDAVALEETGGAKHTGVATAGQPKPKSKAKAPIALTATKKVRSLWNLCTIGVESSSLCGGAIELLAARALACIQFGHFIF